MIKKIFAGLLALIVIIVIGVFVLGNNMDSLIKSSIEKYGTLATKAQTTLGKVQVSISSGIGSLENFKLGNPEGFKSESALMFRIVSIELDTNSVMSKGPIVIRKVLIDSPELTYEVMENGDSNLQKIQNNIKAYAASLTGAQGTQNAPASAKDGQERKIIIEKLVVSNGKVKLSHALLPDKNLIDVNLPTIEMNGIGKNSAGLTGAAMTQAILQKLTSEAIETGQSKLVTELRKRGIQSLKGAVENSEVGKALENSGVGKALGDILGR